MERANTTECEYKMMQVQDIHALAEITCMLRPLVILMFIRALRELQKTRHLWGRYGLRATIYSSMNKLASSVEG